MIINLFTERNVSRGICHVKKGDEQHDMGQGWMDGFDASFPRVK